MAKTFKLLGAVATLLINTTVSAQVNTVVETTPTFDDNIVRAQFIKPGDVSPEEYQALLDEADKIRAFQSSQGAYTGISASTIEQRSDSRFVTDSYGYKIELFDAPVAGPVEVTEIVPTQTQLMPTTSTQAGTVIQSSTPVVIYQSESRTVTSLKSHYVVKGDTLYNIAKRNDVTVSELKAMNGMTGHDLKLGQTLNVPGQTTVNKPRSFKAPITTVSNLAVKTDEQASEPRKTTLIRNVEPIPTSNIYAVLPKDTLYSISRRACVSVSDMSAVNAIEDPSAISPGQRLTLPSGHCLK